MTPTSITEWPRHSVREIGGTKVGTAKVTGRFKSGGKESGTIKTTSNTAKCSGSFSYSAKAA